MTVSMLLGLVAIFAGVVFVAQWANVAQRGRMFVRFDAKRACKGPHVWKRAAFIGKTELEAFKAAPETFANRKHTYCQVCGYVPVLDKMLVPAMLGLLRVKEVEREEHIRWSEDVVKLQELFLSQYLEQSHYKNRRDQDLISEGFLAYQGFAEALPQLMAKLRVDRAAETLNKNSSIQG